MTSSSVEPTTSGALYMWKSYALLCLIIATTAVSSFAQVLESTPPLLLPTSSTRIQSTFGNRLHVHGSWMAIAADHDVPNVPGIGEVYIYKRTELGWSYWQRIQAADGFSGNHFGLTVLLDGETMFVGAPTDDDLGYWSGSVYVFKLENDQWMFESKILPPLQSNSYSLFGLTLSMGIDENELIVGSYLESTDNQTSGAAYVFKRTLNNWEMTQRLTYPGTPGAAYFGRSVAVYDRILVIGVPGLRTSQLNHPHGAVVVYNYVNQQWVIQQFIFPTEPQEFQLFGEWVDLTRDSLAISSPGEDADAMRRGVVHIYDFINGVAVKNTAISPPFANVSSFSFPSIFSPDGNMLFVGAHSSSFEEDDAGSAWIIQRNAQGEWGKLVRLVPDSYSEGDSFGRSMAFDGTIAYVSSPRLDLAGLDSGGVFAFDLNDCDSSGVLDVWELFNGELSDGNIDGIPDNCQAMPWDLNGDNFVNGGDLGLLYVLWGTDGSMGGDFDASGIVDASDFGAILSNWTG